MTHLGDEGAGSGALVSPGRRESTDGLVVTRQAVDTGLDQNEAELAVLVLAVALEMLADSDSLQKMSANPAQWRGARIVINAFHSPS